MATATKKPAAKKAAAKKAAPKGAAKQLENDGRPAGKGKGGKVTQHGVTTTGYQRGCRCDECKAAMREATQKRRDAAKTDEQKAAEKKAQATAKAKATRERKKAEKEAEKAGDDNVVDIEKAKSA